MDYPTTIIVRDPKEQKSKCSIYALRDRDDICLINHPVGRPPDFTNYIRLAPDGPALSSADVDCGVLLLDASWRRADRMVRDFKHVPPRSLTDYHTAFPRVAKLGNDPGNGLASVEAIYVAYRILRRDTSGLLDHYRWAREFLAKNDF